MTKPNAWTPPGERGSPADYGNRRLWTLISPDGRLAVSARRSLPFGTAFGEIHADGSIATKFPWWGAESVGRELRLSGTRLGGHAKPLRATVALGFARAPHFWASTITFAREGCWRVTATAGTAKLTFVERVINADKARYPWSPGPSPRPPAPLVSTLGFTGVATLDSYCWADGRGGLCADGFTGHPAQVLRWRTGVPLEIDLRLAAHGVHFDAESVIAMHAPHDVIHLQARRLERDGRRWRLCLPERAAAGNDLLIYARFGARPLAFGGDVLAEVGLTRDPARSPAHGAERPRPSAVC